ncbi:MAG: iron ABC transporter permease [Chitinophagales bacterium]
METNNIISIRNEKNYWIATVSFFSVLLLVPVAYVISGLFISGGDNWAHLKEHLLQDYVLNTLLLVLFTGLFSLLFGVVPAWLVARYQFPGKKIFSLLLILPLSVPSYIMAFVYGGFFNVYGTLHFFLLDFFPDISYQLDMKNWLGLSFVMGLALFPYVYLILYSSFKIQQETLIEAAQTLGAKPAEVFYKIALPLARPALAGALFLVTMEVLNDYGAASYFGIKTLTTGIFRTWFSLGDIQTAVKLASNLLLVTLFFYFLEKVLQSARKYSSSRTQKKRSHEHKLRGKNALLAFVVCSIPVFLGILLPLFQLIFWALQSEAGFESSGLVFNSALLAFLVAIICLIIAFINAFSNHYFKNFWTSAVVRLSSIGYAIPGAIIAIGVLAPLLWLDNHYGWNTGLLINGSIFALTYACVIRFFAVSYNALDGVMEKMPQAYPDACKLSGVNSLKAFFKIYLPLSKGGLIAGGILVFLDVLKELPLTLILRPFDFNTLATNAFELASDEALRQAALPALCIVAMGSLALLFVRSIIKNSEI